MWVKTWILHLLLFTLNSSLWSVCPDILCLGFSCSLISAVWFAQYWLYRASRGEMMIICSYTLNENDMFVNPLNFLFLFLSENFHSGLGFWHYSLLLWHLSSFHGYTFNLTFANLSLIWCSLTGQANVNCTSFRVWNEVGGRCDRNNSRQGMLAKFIVNIEF